MLEPIVVVLIRPSGMVFFPPVALMPVMVFIPIAVPGPFRVMHPDPMRMILEPPATGMPLVMLVIIPPAMMIFVRMH